MGDGATGTGCLRRVVWGAGYGAASYGSEVKKRGNAVVQRGMQRHGDGVRNSGVR